MWFGTKDGLNRFDGYHFKLFNIRDDGRPLVPDAISCLLIDKQNVLWVGSQKGLYTFDTQKECLVRFLDSLTDITNILIDKKNQLWFKSAYTLCRYNLNNNTLKIFRPEKYFDVTSICLSGEGDLWASTPNGFLQRFDEATETFKSFDLFLHSAPAASNWIQTISPAGKGAIFVGTSSQGLKRFDIDKSGYSDLLIFNPDRTTVFVRDVIKYAENEYWIATESGIFIYNTISQKFIHLEKKFLDPYSLSDNAVYTLCKDAEGGIWAGTYFGGINYYSKQFAVFRKYFPDNSKNAISGSAVREICEDGSGNVWIGTEDAGLNKLNPKTGAITQFKPTGESTSIAYSNIHGLLVAGNDLWIGTFEHGLDIMDTRTGKIKMHYTAGAGAKQLKSNFIISLLQTRAGDIFVGSGNSLFKYDPQTNGFDQVAETPAHIFVSCMLEDHDNTIWVGTQHSGLYYFNPVTKQQGHFENQPSNKNTITTNTINAIFEDSKQNLWFATEGGGLCKLSRDRKLFSAFTAKNGLPSDFTFKVLEDNRKNLWVTTSRGLVNLNPENGSVSVYTKDNGLLNNQFNYNSGYKDADGKMYFGSVKGMIAFNPDELLKPATAPPVFITAFQVQNKELEINEDSSFLKRSILYTDEIILPYDHSSVSIDFAALSFISPEMIAYNYIMKGLDNEWTQIKPNRKIYFTNLAPGKYTFILKAAVNGNWNLSEKKLVIKILPPWWATWWAYAAYTILALALCYYLLRSYHIIVEDKKEKEIYEAKIDFFTNVAHEIRTPLTLIKGPVENLLEIMDDVPEIKEDVIMMERNTNRLIGLVTQILDFRKAETKGFSIDFVKVNIAELLKESYTNFTVLAKKRKLDYTIYCPSNDIIAFADEEAMNKIFSNLFNNAIKYAQKKVTVRLLPPEENTQTFKIEFENDGLKIPPALKEKIFEPFYRLKETLKQQGTGIGLALARSLTELHAGSLYLEDAAEDKNLFVLCLPVKPMENKKEKPGHFKRLLKI
ncbi:MAG: histidine kinase [Ferruginibacter sp.]|nr:histidine kinase [Ferruginibacter sp.]